MITYPTDKNGTTFDPALHNLVEETAQPQLSTKGNFVKIRDGHQNAAETIARFQDSLEKPEQQEDILAQLLGDEEAAGDIDEEVAQENTAAASGEITADDDFEELEIVQPTSENDDEDIMGEPDPEPARPAADGRHRPALEKSVILNTCKLARESEDPARNRANFSNGGNAGNGWHGVGYSLRNINLSGQDLRAAVFNDCDLTNASFEGANLEGAQFSGAVLDGVNFSGANLRFALLPRDVHQVADLDNKDQVEHSFWE